MGDEALGTDALANEGARALAGHRDPPLVRLVWTINLLLLAVALVLLYFLL